MQQRQEQPVVFFEGRDRVHVKRKALDYWYQNRVRLGLSLRHFLLQCRLSSDERTIQFCGQFCGQLRGQLRG